MNSETPLEAAAKSRTGQIALPPPHRSLQSGQWVKLICGASYQDMPTVRRLVMLYALAGVDCIDVAADGAVVAAARQGLRDAAQLTRQWDQVGDRRRSAKGMRSQLLPGLPWLMVSLNDSEDPHFRKAYFDAVHCPKGCDRPCESICPTAAIQFQAPQAGGVQSELCYGCGRCIDVCPVSHIEARPYLARPEAFSTAQLSQIDAVEIHTQTGHQAQFAQLWQRLIPWQPHLKLVSISCPDHPQVVAYLKDLYAIMGPLHIPLIWQTDGRPMSGDLGKGTTHAAIRMAQKVLDAGLPGYVQPAGGTNGYTVSKLLNLGLVNHRFTGQSEELQPGKRLSPLTHAVPHPVDNIPKTIAGIAYGSYGRSQVLPLIDAIDQELQPWLGNDSLDQPATGQNVLTHARSLPPQAIAPPWQRLNASTLGQGLALAQQLVGQLKVDRHF